MSRALTWSRPLLADRILPNLAAEGLVFFNIPGRFFNRTRVSKSGDECNDPQGDRRIGTRSEHATAQRLQTTAHRRTQALSMLGGLRCREVNPRQCRCIISPRP
jgi:hypothetical protein